MEGEKSGSHYDVLRVPQSATLSQIKAAHRTLALKCHPDKQRDDYVNADEFFRIQRAWECLRDPDRREEYNQSLDRVRDKDREQRHLSSLIYVSQMHREICQVETEGVTTVSQSILFSYPCRCGDEFQVLKEDLIAFDHSPQTKHATVISCPSCSLTIQVIHDLV
jgi:hypothetical protein